MTSLYFDEGPYEFYKAESSLCQCDHVLVIKDTNRDKPGSFYVVGPKEKVEKLCEAVESNEGEESAYEVVIRLSQGL